MEGVGSRIMSMMVSLKIQKRAGRDCKDRYTMADLMKSLTSSELSEGTITCCQEPLATAILGTGVDEIAWRYYDAVSPVL